MSDNYQAVYDAVRSKLTNTDFEHSVSRAIRDMNLSHYVEMAMENIRLIGDEQQRPSILLRPKIYIDGDKWCALYGENLQDGIAGFGDSPAEAFADFDIKYHEKLK